MSAEAVSHAVHGNVKSSGAESSSKVLAPPHLTSFRIRRCNGHRS